uniref:Uncharacterized protein n=1 Tax=Solanum lycopersicum TaxID=4081 RepID=A0A3Q7I3P9_SOLLC
MQEESDTHPKHSVKSEAFDVEELANKLQLGPMFYVIGLSMGAYSVLAGVAVIITFVNYWWSCYPSNQSKEPVDKIVAQDQRTF